MRFASRSSPTVAAAAARIATTLAALPPSPYFRREAGQNKSCYDKKRAHPNSQLRQGHQRHAYQLAELLFGQRLKNNEARRMAVAETLSHLEYLRYGGQVEQHKTTEGLILYAVA